MLARYRGKTICPVCKGSRLKPEAEYVKVGGRSISELVNLPISELEEFFDRLELDEHDALIAKRLLTEIRNRICFLQEVGLSYLTLNRLSSTLSGEHYTILYFILIGFKHSEKSVYSLEIAGSMP